MALTTSTRVNQANPKQYRTVSLDLQPAVNDQDFEGATGEPLADTLNVDSWTDGDNLTELYSRLESQVAVGLKSEERIRNTVRKELFPQLKINPGAPPNAGVYQATVEDIKRIHNGLLFNGAVEACDGTSATHDALPVTITQIGVCTVSYHGGQGSYLHRLYRKDVAVTASDPVQDALAVLKSRQTRGSLERASKRDTMTELLRRGIMTYAERAILLDKSSAPWRMGHGNPAAYELITGSGSAQLCESSLDLLERFVLGHQKFVFVPSDVTDRLLLTIGNSLKPLEYAIIHTSDSAIMKIVKQGHYRGDGWGDLEKKVESFADGVGRKIVVGVYRVSDMSPAHVFYSHVEHAHEAALIAMADSALQEHRGFPMMIDLADMLCSGTFGAETLMVPTQVAYARAGEPFRYQTERQTRK